MVEVNEKELIEKALDNLSKFKREGQSMQTGEAAIKAASDRQNIQTEGQSALQEGDVFKIPADKETFDKRVFSYKFNKNQAEPSIGIMVVVLRKGKPVCLPVYSTAFTRGQRLVKTPATYDAEGNVVTPVVWEDELVYPAGQPAKDVRDVTGSVYESLSVLMGKTILVKRSDVQDVQTIRRGAVLERGQRPNDEDLVVGRRRLNTFEYVDAAADATE